MTSRTLLLVVTTSLALGACDDAPPPAIFVRTTDMGRVCLYSESPEDPEKLTPNALKFSEGQVLYVQYESTCLSVSPRRAPSGMAA